MVLTKKQQDFLTHLRNPVSKKAKTHFANQYSRRKDKVQAELAKLPDLGDKVAIIQNAVKKADDLADKGEFHTAYKTLSTAKEAAYKLAEQYDPTDDFVRLSVEIDTTLKKAQPAAAEVKTFQQWLSSSAELKMARSLLASLDKLSAAQRVQEQQGTEQQFGTIEQGVLAGLAKAAQFTACDEFLASANDKVADFLKRCEELKKGCRTPAHENVLKSCADELDQKLLSNPQLAVLKAGNAFFPKTITAKWVADVKQEMGELRQSIATVRPDEKVADKYKEERDADAQALQSANRAGDRAKPDQPLFNPPATVARDEVKAAMKDELADLLIDSAYGNIDPEAFTSQAGQLVGDSLAKMIADNDSPEKRMDLLLLAATSELDELIAEAVPELKLDYDPDRLRQIAEGARKELAGEASTRVQVDANGKEIALLGDDTYGFSRELGRGGLGVAKLFETNGGAKKVVLKEAQTRTNDQVPEDIRYQQVMATNREMEHELRAHMQASKSDSPYVLKLEDLCIDPDGRVRVVMEVAAGGDMQKMHRNLDVLSDLNVLPQEARNAVERYMAAQMLLGVAAMHDAGIVHHDLKGENIFLAADGTVKVADFGSGIALGEEGKTADLRDRDIGTTPAYKPGGTTTDPRVDSPHDEAFDLFTVGKILQQDLAREGKPAKPGAPSKSTTAADRLASGLAKDEHDQRADLDAALETAYIKGVENLEQMPEFKALYEQMMQVAAGPAGQFQKARSAAIHSLDIVSGPNFSQLLSLLTVLGVDESECMASMGQLSTAAGGLRPIVQEISQLSAKEFGGTTAEATAAAQVWVKKITDYVTTAQTLVADCRQKADAFLQSYQQKIGTVNWERVRAKMKEEGDVQEAVLHMPKDEMRAYGYLEACDEVAAKLTALSTAIQDLAAAKGKALEDLRQTARAFAPA